MENTIFWALDNSLMVESKSRNYTFDMISNHFHNEYEIYYLLSGERYYFINDQIYHIKKGNIVFINSNAIHKTSTVNQIAHERFLIHLKRDLFEKYKDILGGVNISELFSASFGVIDLSSEEQHYIEEILFFILEEVKLQSVKYEVLLLAKLAELFVFFIRKQTQFIENDKPATAQTPKYKKVHEVASYISNHYVACGSLDEIAKKFFISKYYLCRIFKEVTGVTVNEYINVAKIKQAKILLEQSHLNITQVAEAVGYDHLTYFEKVFKTYLNITPLKYKKIYREEKIENI